MPVLLHRQKAFRKSLETFPGKDCVEIEWKSFQLDPTIPMDLGEETNVYDYLAARKGISLEQVKQMHDRVSEMAEAVGLHYDFDQAKVANSLEIAPSYSVRKRPRQRRRHRGKAIPSVFYGRQKSGRQ